MPSAQEKLIGAQFDAMDKGVARRATDLMGRQTIAKQTYDEWITDLTQLSDFANQYGAVAYVNKQWTAEIPRYQQIDALISSRVVIANPTNYDNRIPITSGGGIGGCGCGDSLNTTPYQPGNYGGPGLGGSMYFGGDTLFNPSLGDAIRGGQLPYEPFPLPSPLIDKKQVFTQIFIAILIGASLWGFHHLTKKK